MAEIGLAATVLVCSAFCAYLGMRVKNQTISKILALVMVFGYVLSYLSINGYFFGNTESDFITIAFILALTLIMTGASMLLSFRYFSPNIQHRN